MNDTLSAIDCFSKWQKTEMIKRQGEIREKEIAKRRETHMSEWGERVRERERETRTIVGDKDIGRETHRPEKEIGRGTETNWTEWGAGSVKKKYFPNPFKIRSQENAH